MNNRNNSSNQSKKTANSKTSAKKRSYSVRSVVVTGVLAGLASVLMMISFSVPFMPSFIKLDVSELPALLAAFAFGPLEGVAVCLVKNVINAFFSTTGCVGELSNFILGCAFVVPAGLLYKFGKNRRSALLGSVIGAAAMALASLPLNYFVMYPIYSKFMPLDTIISLYQAIYPGVDGLFACLLVFNVPYTFFKGMIDVALAFIVYKRLSPIFHGKHS